MAERRKCLKAQRTFGSAESGEERDRFRMPSAHFGGFSRCWVSAAMWNCFLESKSPGRLASTVPASLFTRVRRGGAGASLEAEPDAAPQRGLNDATPQRGVTAR